MYRSNTQNVIVLYMYVQYIVHVLTWNLIVLGASKVVSVNLYVQFEDFQVGYYITRKTHTAKTLLIFLSFI